MKTDKNKKLKAAIVAVTFYMQQEEAEQSKKPDYWLKSGREQTMHNRYLVQMRNFKR
jgi:hypothetical protein